MLLDHLNLSARATAIYGATDSATDRAACAGRTGPSAHMPQEVPDTSPHPTPTPTTVPPPQPDRRPGQPIDPPLTPPADPVREPTTPPPVVVHDRERGGTAQPDRDADPSNTPLLDAVARLSGGVSQDFNDVLQALRNALELTLRQADDPVRVRHWAEVALQVVDHGSQLTLQLAAFSGQTPLDMRALRVGDFLRRLRPALQRCVGPRISMRLPLATDLGCAMVDAVQLERSMLSLATNARQAMPYGGELVVTCQRVYLEHDAELTDGDYLRISVSDTGSGMTPAVRARAFEPFFTTRAVGLGVGLGLSQVYGFARQSGGTARIGPGVPSYLSPDAPAKATSRRGRGVTVSMWLPALPEFADTLEPLIGVADAAGHAEAAFGAYRAAATRVRAA